MTKKAKQMTLQ